MLLGVNICLLLLLVLLSLQDFRDRAVGIWLFPVLALLLGYKAWLINGTFFFSCDLLLNLSMLTVQLLVLLIYFRVFKKSVAKMLGAGDVLFFFVMAFAFSTLGFIVFFTISLLVSLLLWFFLYRKKSSLIPLAGLQAMCLMFFLIAEMVVSFNPYCDVYILKLLNIIG